MIPMTLPRPTLRDHDALLHEDLVTPMHAHRDADSRLRVETPDGPRYVHAHEVDRLVAPQRPRTEVPDCEHVDGGPRRLSRRHVIQGASAGFGALLAAGAQPRYAFAAPQPAGSPAATATQRDLLVVVFLRGGMDGISAVAPINDPAYQAARGKTAVTAETSIPLDDTFALNKNLAAFQPLWDAKQLAIVHGAGSTTLKRSHFEDMNTVEQAAPAAMRSGWLGRHLQSSASTQGTFRAITIGNRAVLSLSTTAFETLATSTLDTFKVNGWNGDKSTDIMVSMVEKMFADAGGRAAAQCRQTMQAVAGLADVRAVPGDKYVPANGAVYPDTTFGYGLRDVARLAKAGKGLEVACVDLGDWDMHKGLGSPAVTTDWFSRKSIDLSTSIAAFAQDLGPMWARTTVVTMSEFGRRVQTNADLGVDHGHGNVMFVAGGGINGGQVYGSVPSLTPGNLVLGDVPVTTDYRQVLAEILTKRLLNADLATVLPGFTPGPALGIA